MTPSDPGTKRHTRNVVLAGVLALAVGGCDATDPSPRYHGYIEADYVTLAAPEAGWLETRPAGKGEALAQGALVFTLESAREQAVLAEAGARLEEARRTLADLRKGARPEDLAVLEAQKGEAEAGLRLATLALGREKTLVATRASAQVRLDQARADEAAARARVARLEAELVQARLPARADQVAAAVATQNALEAARDQAAWRLAQRTITAPVAGRVEDTVREPGEWVEAGGAVVVLLPDAPWRVVFYVPEPARGGLRLGQGVGVSCDGCPAGLKATISRVASEAEYTPPVIYSLETRAKLVYRIEARLTGADTPTPGQPVDVEIGS
ncbi:HlyD family secretion protein [Pararhodospirillum oryzae]|uniref:Secretion protein HlyD n=1 Tax=Pararhodospirillum oryzae TaxID=478448 RepID=A0A512H3U6_9PROT|nr:HlyD family efflux transporter periplasmic adaptor subunit [Pararhodospirillum oryzae]GEO80111.1 secretion protein HlyD [Pararhodospirillum oryzae]